ncbi:hypothetical protein HJC99_05015 [Candidatus Saccharibacteria bacterium]|nr:hypothetical protein [Candidatus Saccharibacteria bacterium]
MGRSPNTVSDEIKRNSVWDRYEVESAKRKSYYVRKYAKYQGKKIQENMDLRWYIIVRLQAHWNPDEIAGAISSCFTPPKLPFTTGYVPNGASVTASFWTHSDIARASARRRRFVP